MEFAAAGFVLIVSVLLAYQFSKGCTRKKKYVIWGVTTMFIIAPGLSWLVSMGYGLMEQNGWAGVALLGILFPLMFLIGLVLFLIGIFSKKDAVRSI